MTDISIIGLGAMGSALARAQMKSGRSISVWNRTPEKAAPLIADGANAVGTVSDALSAGPVIVTCVKSHPQTLEVLTKASEALLGKTIIELSTGGAKDAEDLAQFIENAGGEWMVGIINAYPHMIGGEETVLSVVGPDDQWEKHGSIIKTMGGQSVLVGDKAGMLAALFAGLFTVRQGFMWA